MVLIFRIEIFRGICEMSGETEARERRRNRLLQSKEERMSRILGSTDSKGANTENEIKVESRDNTTAQIKVPRSPPRATPTAAKVVHSVTPPSQAVKSDKTELPSVAKPNSRAHVLAILATALFVVASFSFSRSSNCTDIIGSHCARINSSAYLVLITVFCCLESVEFLTGRLDLSGGLSSAYVILKDFSLYLLIILIWSMIQYM